jgi:hypothetical protein
MWLTLARSLGWFGIVLGIAEVLMPRLTASLMGADRGRALLPALGAREIASGVGILAAARPTAGLWARVIGDAIDLGVLGRAYGDTRRKRGRVLAWIVAVALITALDVAAAGKFSAAGTRRSA